MTVSGQIGTKARPTGLHKVADFVVPVIPWYAGIVLPLVALMTRGPLHKPMQSWWATGAYLLALPVLFLGGGSAAAGYRRSKPAERALIAETTLWHLSRAYPDQLLQPDGTVWLDPDRGGMHSRLVRRDRLWRIPPKAVYLFSHKPTAEDMRIYVLGKHIHSLVAIPGSAVADQVLIGRHGAVALPHGYRGPAQVQPYPPRPADAPPGQAESTGTPPAVTVIQLTYEPVPLMLKRLGRWFRPGAYSLLLGAGLLAVVLGILAAHPAAHTRLFLLVALLSAVGFFPALFRGGTRCEGYEPMTPEQRLQHRADDLVHLSRAAPECFLGEDGMVHLSDEYCHWYTRMWRRDRLWQRPCKAFYFFLASADHGGIRTNIKFPRKIRSRITIPAAAVIDRLYIRPDGVVALRGEYHGPGTVEDVRVVKAKRPRRSQRRPAANT